MAQNPPPRPRKRRVPPKQHQVGDLEVQIKNGKAPPLRQWGMTAGSDPVAGWNTGDLAQALAAHTRGNFAQSGRLDAIECFVLALGTGFVALPITGFADDFL